MLNFYVLLLVGFSCVHFSYNENIASNEEPIIFDLASEVVRINDKGVHSSIEVFKPITNEAILKERNQKKYELLKFYSFGRPTLVASENDTLFFFTSKGFYIQVEILTKSQRTLVQDELELKHSVDLNENQIRNLIPTKFECTLEIECDEFFYLDGSVLNTNEYPLKVHFNLTKKSKELQCLQKIVREDEDDFSFDCQLATNLVYANKETSLIGRSYIFNKGTVKNISPDYKFTEKLELINDRVSKLEKIVEKLVEAVGKTSNLNTNENSNNSTDVEPDTLDLESEDNSPYDE